MSKVSVLVGTRKGAFILTADGKREKWTVSGPHFAGWEIYHMKGSPASPNRIYASQTSGWFGQIIQRSDDGGKTWIQPGTPPGESTTGPGGAPKAESNKFVYDTSAETGKPLTTHQWYDGTQHPWEFKRVNPRSPNQTSSTPVSRMPPSSVRKTAANPGKSFRDFAATARVRSGSQALVACVCIASFTIPAILSAWSSPSLPRARFEPTMAAKPGSPSTKACTRNTFPIPPPKWAIASITSR